MRFVEQVESMYAHGVRVFVEAGPGRVLTQQVGKILGDRPHAMVACDVSGELGIRRLLLAAAELATLGIDLDTTALFAERAEPVELRTLPLPRPGWLVDGAFVRTQDGTPVTNSLQPADQLPAVALGGRGAAGSEVDGTVREYLHNIRQLVAAERDVMLTYLGGAVPVAGGFDQLPPTGTIAATASLSPDPAVADEPAEAGGPRPALTGADLLAVVMGIVSDRTGYPVEMLDPDLDLEADLSIDSIKRIEIVGELAEKVGIPGMDESAIDEDLVEELAQLKTLRTMVAWLDELTAQAAGDAPAAPVEAKTAAAPEEPLPDLPPTADRFVVETAMLGPAVALGDIEGQRALVVGDGPLVAPVLAALQERGASAEALAIADPSAPLPDEAEAAIAAADLVVDLTTVQPGLDARAAFTVLAPAVLGSASRVLAVTDQQLGGSNPTGVPGLARALSREFPSKLVRSVEVDVDAATADPQPLAAALVDELLDPDAGAALSWVGGQRAARIVGGPTDRPAPDDLGLTADSVVVLTGGARGITARAAVAIAEASSARLVLVGRSALPGPEAAATADAPDATGIRRALLDAGELKTPAEIEAACTRILADREIRASLAAIEAAGSPVEYHAVDVRSDEFGALIDDVRARHGRIDGFIHGAGVLDDRFVRDKTVDGFDRVFGTKVDGARTILAKRDADTRFVVLFGSVSGAFGNKGQCDYAAANDALDNLSQAAEPGGRVVSIDWGPWGGGGMVSAELEREYARRGIGLIDPDDGVAAMLEEIARPEGPAQVVVLRGTIEAFTGEAPAAVGDEVSLSD